MKKEKVEKEKIEFRYYEMPANEYVLPKLGKGWEQQYGLDEHGVLHKGRLHFHNYLEVGYCYSGHGRMIISDRVYRYENDERFTIIPANIPHTTESDEGGIDKWEFLFIDIDAFVRTEMTGLSISPEEILRIINKRGTMKSRKNHPLGATLVRQIMDECRQQEPYYQEAIKGYLRALVIEAMRLVKERDRNVRNVKYNRYIEMAARYIDAHYAEEMKIADIASICGLSESHFRRIFDDSMNMKPVDYINMVRVNKACEMLVKEDVPMSEIGKRVGYQTASSFNRNFKALTGYSPLQWKNKGAQEGINLKNYQISALRGWEANGEQGWRETES